MHLPKYTARVSIVLASLVVISSVIYQRYSQWEHQRNIQNSADKTEDFNPVLDSKSDGSWESSPLCRGFYKVICQGKEIVTDPTGIVQPDVRGEVEALRLYEMILHEHPSWTNEQVDEELVKRIYTPKRKRMLEEIFQWIQIRMIRLIRKQSSSIFSAEAKKLLVSRIENIRLEIPPPAQLYANEPDLFTKNDVYYESISAERRIIRVGGAYLLSAKSWFNRVFTIAHEMSHSIDPCELVNEKFSSVGYQNLLNCFQELNLLKAEQVKDRCVKNHFLGELFADWLATQIAVQALEVYSSRFKTLDEISNSVINSVKDLCHQESWLTQEVESHPPPKDRIEKIFGSHPGLQSLLSCPGEHKTIRYCTFEGKK